MGGFSWWHWLIVLAVVLLLFGGKKIPELMKGLGTGIKSFKKAVREDEEDDKGEPLPNSTKPSLQPQEVQPVALESEPKKQRVRKSTATESTTSVASKLNKGKKLDKTSKDKKPEKEKQSKAKKAKPSKVKSEKAKKS